MSENSACSLRRGAVVIIEQPTEPLPPTDGTAGARSWQLIDQLVVQPLVVPLAVIVRHKVSKRLPKVAFSERNHAVKAFLSNRAHEPLRIGIAIRSQERCANHPHARHRKLALDAGAPLSIAIADQHAIPDENPIDRVGQVTHCWITNASSGFLVEPRTSTRREWSSITNSV